MTDKVPGKITGPEDQWSCKRLHDYWSGIITRMKKVAKETIVLI